MSGAQRQLAQAMRRIPTDAEARLWAVLRSRQLQNFKFRRQHPVGPYIADFAYIAQRMIVEADGGQHAENSDDARRTAALESWGWQVLRFWNTDILSNTEGVLTAILQALQEKPSGGGLGEWGAG